MYFGIVKYVTLFIEENCYSFIFTYDEKEFNLYFSIGIFGYDILFGKGRVEILLNWKLVLYRI